MPVTGWPNHFCAAGCTASLIQRSSVETIGQASVAGGETDAVDFFPVHALPPLSTGRVLASQIARLYQHRLDPSLPTDFD